MATTETASRPNLFIIGASKTGTSSLHAYLEVHPEIYMAREKEPCFFVEQDALKRHWPLMARHAVSHDRDTYLALFEPGGDLRYRGESSTFYAMAPHMGDVPGRIAEMAPDARLIYVVREPVSRAISHYWQEHKSFHETRPIEEAFGGSNIYVDTSDYARQLEAYLERFPREAIHILSTEDLRDRRVETLEALFAWLGLEPIEFTEAQLAARHVSPATSRKPRFPGIKALRDSPLWAPIRQRLPASTVNRLRSMATTRFDKDAYDDSAVKAQLEAIFPERIAAFEETIGRRFEAWRR